MNPNELISSVHFDERGLVPAIVQDARTGVVLMLAYMNAQAIEKTITTSEAHFWSRSRQELWHKGASSGNVQFVVDIRIDCDQDALLLRVNPAGPACHTGHTTCFFQRYDRAQDGFIEIEALPGQSE
jgi:phosphoribosyl-ATP pyrophosphohydrolase/phosphoribosyl-AMP cyclohydrolase